MNRKICGVFLGAMLLMTAWSFAQEIGNLLKNNVLKFNEQGKLPGWDGNCKPVSGTGYKAPNSVCLKWKKGKATMLQTVNGLKPGKYIFSAYIKLDRKIGEIVLIRIIKLDDKEVYQGTSLKSQDQAKPGTWDKVMAVFDIPEGIDSATIAFDLREKSGATAWIDSPSLTYKEEE